MLDAKNSLQQLNHRKNYSISQLIFSSVKVMDSGIYSCQPASLDRVKMALHVIEDTSQELMVGSGELKKVVGNLVFIVIIGMILRLCRKILV